MNLMNRFPIIIVLGAALLGYTAGEMMLNDKAIARFVESNFPLGHIIIPVVLAILVIITGKLKNKALAKTDKAS
jgi:predicted tellurium resistance membrane protein TerC